MNKDKQLILVLENLLSAAKDKNIPRTKMLNTKYDSLCIKLYGEEVNDHPRDMDICRQTSFFSVAGMTLPKVNYSKAIKDAENQLKDIKKKYKVN